MSVFGGLTGDVTAAEDARYRDITAPADLGFLAWSLPLDVCGSINTTAIVSGTALVVKVHLNAPSNAQGSTTAGQTVTNVWLNVCTIGATLTASQSIVGLYSPAGALLGSSAVNSASTDLATAFTSLGLKQIALTAAATGSLTSLPAGDYYVAVSQVGTTPALFRGAAIVAVNGNLAATASKYGTASTSNTTALPASIGTVAAYAGSVFAALS